MSSRTLVKSKSAVSGRSALNPPAARPSPASPATRKQAAIDSQLTLLAAITAIQSAYIAGESPEQVCRLAVQSAMNIVGAHCGFIAELGKSPDASVHLRWLIVQTEVPCPADSWELALADVLPALYEACTNSGHVLIDPRLSDHAALAGMARHIGCISFLALPIRVQNETMGLLCLSRSDAAFQPSVAEQIAPLIGTLGQLLGAYRATAAAQAANEALADANQLHHAILKSAIDSIISFDQNGTIFEYNQAAEKTFGHSRSQAIGQKIGDLLFAPEHLAPLTRGITRMILGGKPTAIAERIEALAVHADGHEIPIEYAMSAALVDGQYTITAYLHDITERQRSETEVKQALNMLKGIFQISPDGCLVFNSNGYVTDCNPSFAYMVGYRREHLLGMDSTQIDKLLLSLGAAQKNNTPISALHDEAIDTLELAKPRHQALQRTARLSFTDNGRLICKVLYLRDITREMEVDRMKSDFLSTAAHELRTPMASIHGFSELLMMRQYDEKTRAELIGTIHRQSSKLIGLVNELLDLARIEARGAIELRVSNHALEPLIQLATQAIHLTPQHRIELHLSEILPDAYVDPEKFHQMLLNVLSNAVKYSPKGGCIEVRAEPAKRKGQPMVLIEVRDPGLGMTPEQVQRIFERFFRADPSGSIPGTGLGMALVKEIAELHKGEIEIDSTPGAGTTVRMWLPAVIHAKRDATPLSGNPETR